MTLDDRPVTVRPDCQDRFALIRMTDHTSSAPDDTAAGSVYERCDPAFLRQLHEASGMDETHLARLACLSVAQVRQLASGGDSLFYSQTIKRQAYKRLLMILGAAPPPHIDDPEVATAPAAPDLNPRETIDSIIALSHRDQYLEHRPVADALQDLRLRIQSHLQPLAALLFLMLAIGLFMAYWPQSATTVAEPVKTAVAEKDKASVVASPPVVTPAPITPAPAPAAPAPVVAAPAEPVVAPVAPAPAPTPVVAAAAPAVTGKACGFSSDKLPEVMPSLAQKEGRYVYLVSPVNTEVCVVDGNRQATPLSLRAGEGRSVYGAAPWQVSGVDLAKVQIYFQGWRVALPDGGAQRVALIEKPL